MRDRRIVHPRDHDKKQNSNSVRLEDLIIIQNESTLGIDLWMTLEFIQNARCELFANCKMSNMRWREGGREGREYAAPEG
jgi:hypothetical protein